MTAGNHGDLVVVGGGVVGLGAAREAALRGLRVILVERGHPGREASWAAAGMLSPFSEAEADGPFLDFGLRSLELWPGWAAELEAAAGHPVGYRESGKLRVALSLEEEERLRARLRWAAARGLEARWVDGEELRETEPLLTPHARGGLLLEKDFQVDNRLLGAALEEAGRRAGAEIRSGSAVRGIRSAGGRVEGVTLEDGSRIDAPRVLLAAGAWSAEVGGLPRPLPVRPVRGQMLALLPAVLPSSRLLESEEVYLVPRGDGRLLVGATVEDVGFRPGVTAEGIRGLLAGVLRLVPGARDAPIAELWSGFRPGTADGNPILGPDPDLEGLLLGTGHFRNGVLLAPLTALILGALAAGEAAPSIPEPFRPGRIRRGAPGSG